MKSYLQLSILCTASFFVFLAYNSTQNLESTANEDVGTTAIGTLYVVIIVATGAAPKVIDAFGEKWALFFSSCTYLIFIGSNLIPKWYTMIPAAVILGMGAAVLWPSTLSLIKIYSEKHSEITGEAQSKSLDKFTSIFWGSFQFSQLIGSLLIYLIMQYGDKDVKKAEGLLTVLFVLCAAFGCLLYLLLQSQQKDVKIQSRSINYHELICTLKSKKCLLLLALYFYNGIEQGFAWCNFTKGMVHSVYNSEAMIGIMMLCYSSSNAMVSSSVSQLPSTGFLTKAMIIFAVTSQIICITLVHFFSPNMKSPLFVCAVILGIGDALLNTKISLLLGMDFQSKEHVGIISIWRGVTSLGCAVPFFISKYCTITQEVLIFGVSGLLATALFAVYCSIHLRRDNESERPLLSI